MAVPVAHRCGADLGATSRSLFSATGLPDLRGAGQAGPWTRNRHQRGGNRCRNPSRLPVDTHLPGLRATIVLAALRAADVPQQPPAAAWCITMHHAALSEDDDDDQGFHRAAG